MKPVKHKQSGFTLIEALLTLFILAIGMLGVAGLQMQSLRSGGVAMQRMGVAFKAQDLIDRVRASLLEKADANAQNQGAYIRSERALTLGMYANAAGVNANCINGTICDTAQMVAYDIYQWERELQTFLPGVPTTAISVNGLSITIDVTWTDRGEDYRYTVTSQI